MSFSVLMSLYYKEEPHFLDKCLDSLFCQTLKADEIVMVFDGPIPSSLNDVVNKWKVFLPIVVFPLEFNVGLGKALNFGLLQCSNELVARMDTDDICLPERFELQIAEFSRDPALDICGSSIIEIDPITLIKISERKVSVKHDEILSDLVWKNPFNHMTVMYKKNSILSVGSYIDLPWMEDWYLWLRLLSGGFKSTNIGRPLVLARTGTEMINRRSGFKYIRSEWLMTKYKIDSELFHISTCLLSFIKRSVPRLMPGFILSKIYALSRR